jgi:hypothetical protein
MNIMFTTPAAVASSIVACRSFVSLTSFLHKDVYVHSTAPCPSRPHPSGGFIGHGDVGTNDFGCDSMTPKKKGSLGNSIAGIAFRSMGAGIDSMGQAYSMDELDASRTINSLAATPGYGFSGTGESGGEVVHPGIKVDGRDGVPMGHHVKVVDLEKVESLSHGPGHKSFVSDVSH